MGSRRSPGSNWSKAKSSKEPVRFIDGQKLVLAMWLVVEEREDGIPVTLRLLQDNTPQTMGEALVAAGLCTKEEIESGEAQKRVKPTIHLMWTPVTMMVKETV